MRIQGSQHQALCGGPHSCCCLPAPLLVYSVEAVGRLPPPKGSLQALHV